MNLNRIILIWFFAAINLTTFGQQQSISPLKVGDKIPDFVFKNLQNTSNKTQNASMLYKNGLLIINFWATWCVPCVREMPYIDSLSFEYRKDCNIVCVTDQSETVVTNYLHDKGPFRHLVFKANDRILVKYFPHKTVPHNIWIDRDGVIKAITGDEEVNEKNIVEFTLGNANLHDKEEDLTFDYRNTLKVADTAFLYRSVLTPYRKNINNGGLTLSDSTAAITRFLGWNTSKTDLLWFAYLKNFMQVRDSAFITIRTRDSAGFFLPVFTKKLDWQRSKMVEYQHWAERNLYCYELNFSNKISLDRFFKQMQNELSLLFNVRANVEYQDRNCWVITRHRSILPVLRSKSSEIKILQIEGSSLVANNQTIKQIAERLSQLYGNEPPFVDRTGIDFNIDIKKNYYDLTKGLTISMVKTYFNEIGFDFTLKKIKYPCLIVYDNNY